MVILPGVWVIRNIKCKFLLILLLYGFVSILFVLVFSILLHTYLCTKKIIHKSMTFWHFTLYSNFNIKYRIYKSYLFSNAWYKNNFLWSLKLHLKHSACSDLWKFVYFNLEDVNGVLLITLLMIHLLKSYCEGMLLLMTLLVI